MSVKRRPPNARALMKAKLMARNGLDTEIFAYINAAIRALPAVASP